jgi:hypothetical protein
MTVSARVREASGLKGSKPSPEFVVPLTPPAVCLTSGTLDVLVTLLFRGTLKSSVSLAQCPYPLS